VVQTRFINLPNFNVSRFSLRTSPIRATAEQNNSQLTRTAISLRDSTGTTPTLDHFPTFPRSFFLDSFKIGFYIYHHLDYCFH
jgi:hypothetical protein